MLYCFNPLHADDSVYMHVINSLGINYDTWNHLKAIRTGLEPLEMQKIDSASG